MDPLVSVVIPCYNAAETLEHTLNSVVRQDYSNYEVILVDDGSTDGTLEIIRRWEQTDSRFRGFSQGNRGPAAARNFGVSKAQGELIAFLDSDDICFENSVTERVAAIVQEDTPDLLGAFCPAEMINTNGEKMYGHLVFNYRLPNNRLYFSTMAECPFGTPVIIKKTVFLTFGGFDESLSSCEDWDLWQRMMRTGKYFLFVDSCRIGYVQRPASSAHKLLKHYENWKIVSRRVFSEHPDKAIEEFSKGYGSALCYESLSNRAFTNAATAAALGHDEVAQEISQDISRIFIEQTPVPILEGRLKFSILRSLCRTEAEWKYVWPNIRDNIHVFLDELNDRFGGECRTLTALKDSLTEEEIETPVEITDLSPELAGRKDDGSMLQKTSNVVTRYFGGNVKRFYFLAGCSLVIILMAVLFTIALID